jgi:hypothetical protein
MHVRQCTSTSTPPARTSICERRIALGGGILTHCRSDQPQRSPRDSTVRQGAGSIGQSSCEHSSQPWTSRASYGGTPWSIAACILWHRSQSDLSVISATHSWGEVPAPSHQSIGSAGAGPLAFYVIGWIALSPAAEAESRVYALRPLPKRD